MADVKCSAGYGRNLFRPLCPDLVPFSIFNNKRRKKEEKEKSKKKKSIPKSANDEIHVYTILPYVVLTTETVWDADICPSMIDLI